MPEEGSERELEEFLAGTGVFSPEKTAEVEQPPETEEPVEVVRDEKPGHTPLPGERQPPPEPTPSAEEEPVEEQPEEQEGEEQGDPHVVWATKKFGKEPERWAKAAYEREQHISRMAEQTRQAEEAAAQAIAYAREIEANASSSTAMPMSAQEEAWVEQAMSNPVGYAYQAAMAGNAQLYNAVIEKIAEYDPSTAANVGTQVQLAMHNERQRLEAEAASRNGNAASDFNSDLGSSFQRLGINVQEYGQAMWQKFEELGEYHPYTLAALGGDAIQRDLAVSAVYDLVRAGQTTTRRVADTEREEQIRREGELRRDAAGVVTGAPHVSTPKQSPLFDAMEEEWRRRGQWQDEE